jgi:osomolarity two-component system, sensor histidine kinase SLN1
MLARRQNAGCTPCAVHLFSLNVITTNDAALDILKIQHKATQKAQVNERNAAESKRRLTSYIFHEVRVPLNSALLAVQNMAAAGIFRKSHELEFTALEGSLSMMSKVLNDMLDFNRLDAGRFESVSRPFSFHQVIKTLCVPLQMATNSRGQSLIVELDPLIDQFARRATGESEDAIMARPNDPGIMIGDEMRLRQVINNLASNACKFTPSGGTVSVRTKLVWPTTLPGAPTGPHPQAPEQCTHPHPKRAGASSRSGSGSGGHAAAKDGKPGNKSGNSSSVPALSADALESHNARHQKPASLEQIIVRIEVQDTGVGIQSHDFTQNNLFSELALFDLCVCV